MYFVAIPEMFRMTVPVRGAIVRAQAGTALIVATLSDADVLVTEDKHLRKRVEVKAPGRVWSFEDFYYPTVYDPMRTF
jgi:hypothetical protein